MSILKTNDGLVIESILNDGFYLEDGQGHDDELFPHTKETEEIFQKVLYAKETILDEEVLEHVSFDSQEGKIYGSWFNQKTADYLLVYFDL